jgi:hypothetical protein
VADKRARQAKNPGWKTANRADSAAALNQLGFAGLKIVRQDIVLYGEHAKARFRRSWEPPGLPV